MIFSRSSTEARLEALYRSQAVIEFKPDGTIVTANANFLDAMGYSLNEVRGKHHRLFVLPAERESSAYREFWAALDDGKFQSAEYKRIAKGGREIWLQATYNPIRNRNGKVTSVVKFATDITEQKLRNADNQGKIDAIDRSQGVIEFGTDGIILTANANFLKVVGYHLDEIRGQHHRLFVETEECKGAAYNAFWTTLARGEFQASEYKRIGKGGREIWLQATYNPIFDAAGKPMKVVKFATDITAEKMRNAELQGQVSAIGRSQGVIQFDLSGFILDVNENFLAALGYCLDEMRGQHHKMLVEPAYGASAAYQEFWRKLGNGDIQADIFKRVGKGGRDIWIQASYNPIFDMNGKPFKVVKYATDITAKMTSQIQASDASSQTLMNVQAVASAAEELNASIAEIAESLARSRSEVDQMDSRAQAADQSTGMLKSAAASMSGIVQLIQGVGAQINLLALNATIEAARAGEAGRGFAVVAGEVKNLSNQVTSATARIGDEITAMQRISGDVVDSLAAISQSITAVRGFVTGVSSAVEEQSAVTQEISSSMQTAAHSVADINQSLQALAS